MCLAEANAHAVGPRRVFQHPHAPFFVNDHAWRGHRQAVLPLAGEDLRALEELRRQPDAPRVVETRRLDRNDSQSALRRLQAEIRSIQMKSQRRVKLQRRVPGNHQQQFIERGDTCRQLRCFAQLSSSVKDPADPMGRERPSCRIVGPTP